MNANREQQRERLVSLLVMTDLSDTAGTDLRPFEKSADYMLDNGVTVELSPEPDIAPGTTGWATTDLMTARGIFATDDETGDLRFWFANGSGEIDFVSRRYLKAFVPDPNPLTAEAVERIVHELYPSGSLDLSARDILRDALAPYVAKGGA